ncbi:flagellar hook-basal body complex protein FliE [Legionella jordanis]|uniref:Flagellar hook-basal body complex protein FliE n=1 Tax=Legionella jordanis TaxID=456 RepID=A0A0W0V8K6_9GAMM|nr:flagellar hook-basal body complex protein FliE [Legionella jordanis]KTD16469.1 flagellar hook-basal body complex protein [Legionella jordanis]RMX03981.1 flagellar hook-basal body complex protein FliE [Legionella jordanis]RMX15271.1 flagellar hook-basal body complex protein FliE [Legionella jordanis]VEH12071.1 flagellar hook-basal body complex protein FliE [Legionella jordanis]HAT8712628.1 flagellar hook-basal body complex protein FliE [Legionella jordanis]
MSEINTASVLNQLRVLAAKAEGSSVEFNSPGTAFSDYLHNALGEVNHLQQGADNLKTRFELGDKSVGVGEVMVAAQKSSLAFEATLRVRNKLVQAYQDIMNMPV